MVSITEQEQQELKQIWQLLDEAYHHYFEHSDGYCKSGEGFVGVEFNNFFDRRDGESFGIKSVEIYSYVFGPKRSNYFKSTTEALSAVKAWHAREMADTYEEEA
ncbi:hypothetical protein [Streptomyces cinereoruber]|uniref:hypothetical protein n=1 Tax=Streptomyces cinereoruber TaxID=67260 RepID=UPI00364B9AF4